MDTPSDLVAVLRQKKEWLSKMLAITQSFRQLLADDRIEEFAAGLKQREAIIAKIDTFAKKEQRIEPRDGTDPDGLRAKTQVLIREILRLDAENATLAAKKLQQYKEQIRSLNESKKGIGNYAKTHQDDDAFFVDAKK